MKIEYFTKDVYGLPKLYVKDQKLAGLISKLTGRVTLSKIDLDALKGLGFVMIETLRS